MRFLLPTNLIVKSKHEELRRASKAQGKASSHGNVSTITFTLGSAIVLHKQTIWGLAHTRFISFCGPTFPSHPALIHQPED